MNVLQLKESDTPPVTTGPFKGLPMPMRGSASADKKDVILGPYIFAELDFVLWGLGALLFAAGLGQSLWKLHRIYRRTEPVDDGRLALLFEDAKAAAGLKSQILLRLAGESNVSVAVTWGALRPVVVLPNCAVRWQDDRLKTTLLHELGHISRRDWIDRIFASLVCCIYWFSPFVWFSANNLRRECESACDDFAISLGVPPEEYASHLLETAKDFRAPTFAIQMAGRGKLERRLRSILAPHVARGQSSWRVRLAFAAVAVVAVLSTAEYRFCEASGAVSNNRFESAAAGDDDSETGYSVGDGNDAVVAPSPAAAMTLANRAIVRLIYVGESQNPAHHVWTPGSGAIIQTKHATQSAAFQKLPSGVKGRSFDFDIVCPAENSAEKSLFGKYSHAAGTAIGYQYVPNDRLDEEYPTSRRLISDGSLNGIDETYSEPFRTSRRLARVRLSVATGPFPYVAGFPVRIGTADSAVSNAPARCTLTIDPQAAPGLANVLVKDDLAAAYRTPNAFPDFQRYIVLLDRSGHVAGAYPLEFKSFDSDLSFICDAEVPKSELARSAKIEFVARRYYDVEFDRVHLDPS